MASGRDPALLLAVVRIRGRCERLRLRGCVGLKGAPLPRRTAKERDHQCLTSPRAAIRPATWATDYESASLASAISTVTLSSLICLEFPSELRYHLCLWHFSPQWPCPLEWNDPRRIHTTSTPHGHPHPADHDTNGSIRASGSSLCSTTGLRPFSPPPCLSPRLSRYYVPSVGAMLRNKTLTVLQKTYDDSYLSCSTAVYYESQVRRHPPYASPFRRLLLTPTTYHKLMTDENTDL